MRRKIKKMLRKTCSISIKNKTQKKKGFQWTVVGLSLRNTGQADDFMGRSRFSI